MRIPKIPGFKRRRKYPVRRDEYGKSARKRCFEMFEDEYSLTEVIAAANVPKTTVYKYHQQWLKDPHIEKQIAYLKPMLARGNPNRDKQINQMVLSLGIEREKVEALLASPYGLQRLLTFKTVFPGHEIEYYKRYMSLTLGMLMADHLLTNKGRFEDIYYAFAQLMNRYRQDREAGTEAYNQKLIRVRSLLETLAENEANGQTDRGKLTDEEINAVLKMQQARYIKSIETKYWIGIATLMQDGISMEEAREKMYQDFLNKGDEKGAKELRAYQDKVHPLKPQPVTPTTGDDSKLSGDQNIQHFSDDPMKNRGKC
jgi:hypothetical protein